MFMFIFFIIRGSIYYFTVNVKCHKVCHPWCSSQLRWTWSKCKVIYSNSPSQDTLPRIIQLNTLTCYLHCIIFPLANQPQWRWRRRRCWIDFLSQPEFKPLTVQADNLSLSHYQLSLNSHFLPHSTCFHSCLLSHLSIIPLLSHPLYCTGFSGTNSVCLHSLPKICKYVNQRIIHWRERKNILPPP